MSISEILEEELAQAVEVRDRKSLHRYVMLLVGSVVERNEYMNETNALHSDIRLIAEKIDQGFRRMDERFAAVDKRFEDMQAQMNTRFEVVDKRFEDVNRRFTMMFTFMTIGFTAIVALMSIFRFLVP